MKSSVALLLASAAWASAARKDCTPRPDASNGAIENGNWFCGQVDNIQYKDLPQSGKYQDVDGMDENGGIKFQTETFNSPLGALAKPLTLHGRGPLEVKQFAFYNLDAKQKRSTSSHHHGHRHLHHRRDVGDLVRVPGLGEWINTYDGKNEGGPGPKPNAGDGNNDPCDPPVAAAAAAAQHNPPPPAQAAHDSPPAQPPHGSPPVQASPGSPPNAQNEPVQQDHSASTEDASRKGDATPSPAKSGPSDGDWVRRSYYNSKEGIAENLMFMGNYGPLLPGEDPEFKASLAYLNADGIGPSDSPQTLRDAIIPSNKEFSIFTAEKCDDSCGYLRNKKTGYKGFGGQNRLFLLEFRMPRDARGDNIDKSMYSNDDKPAIWFLNSRITYIGQYSKYSCWKTGCGEFDLYETVVPGDTKMKTAFHFEEGTTNSGGSSDYFPRPVDKPIKIAVVMVDDGITITMLPDDFDFSVSLSDEAVRNLKKGLGEKSSVFEIVG